MTAIEESKDPNTFLLDELVGSLLTNKMKVKQNEDSKMKTQETNKKVGVALKSTSKKKKSMIKKVGVALNMKDMTMFARKFNKFMKMKKY